MSLESVFKLSLVMNMIDHLSGPMATVASKVGANVDKLDAISETLAKVAKAGAVMQETGSQIVGAVLEPVEATFETRRALGELASLGVADLGAVEDAARSFSDQWAGTTKADFIAAAYDIKSGIASLTDEGVARYTELAGLTAKATKASVGEMTSLFATGYGIYKGYYDDLSDIEFAEVLSAGISQSVKQFKTTGSEMGSAIESLGAAATNANVPMEEQLSILGMLQATMSGSEAGTKYAAFLQAAAKAGEELGLSFLDASNQLKSMPEIIDQLRRKYGETIDAVEKQELAKAFGTDEAVDLIDLMYGKLGDLQENIVSMYDALGSGTGVAQAMASAINETEPERYERLQQRIQNVKESIGSSLLPTVNDCLSVGEQVLTKVGTWINENQELVRVIMLIVLAGGGFLAIGGTLIMVIGGVGIIVTKAVSAFRMMQAGFAAAKLALTPLISSVWSFTSALLANPATWVVAGIMALIAAIVLLYNKCEWFRNAVNAIWTNIVQGVVTGWETVKSWFLNGLEAVKGLITGAIGWFGDSGKAVIDTFAEGIKSAFSGAVSAVKDGLQKIRNMLPFSDAKTGPLSTLTLSGQRTMTTYAEGLHRAEDAPAAAMERSLERTGDALKRKPVQQIRLTGGSARAEERDSTGGRGYSDGMRTVIQKLIVQTSLKDMKDLKALMALIRELEEYAEGGSEEEITLDWDALPSPV